MICRASVLLATMIVAGATAYTNTALIGSRIPDFTIEDQFEREWNAGHFKGETTVFVLSDRSGYEYSDNWTKVLVPRFKSAQVRFVPVADLRTVPGFLKGFIRGQFKDKFTYSVLMDWDGVLITNFNMTEGYPNFVVVNRKGVVEHVTYGKGTAAQIEALATRLQKVIDAK